jgi:hypothetical protein
MKSKQAVLIQEAKLLHKACLDLVESDMNENWDIDQFISAIERFERVYWPILPKDSALIRKLRREGDGE